MIALFSLFKIQKFNKGKDCNLVIEDVACVTLGGKENVDFFTPFFFFFFSSLARMGLVF